MKFCQNCGHKLSSNTRFCPYCGTKVGSTSQVIQTQATNDQSQKEEAYRKEAEHEVHQQKMDENNQKFHDHSFGTITTNIMRGLEGIPSIILCTAIVGFCSLIVPFLIPFEIIGCICAIYNFTTNPIKNNNFQVVVYNIGLIYSKLASFLTVIICDIVGFLWYVFWTIIGIILALI